MKTLLLLFVVVLFGCTTPATPVENQANGSKYQLELVATTPEGVNVYRVWGNGYTTNIVINPKTGDVGIAIH